MHSPDHCRHCHVATCSRRRRIRSGLLLHFLLAFIASLTPLVQAQANNANTTTSNTTFEDNFNNATFVEVACPQNQTTFTARTQMALIGRNNHLRVTEGEIIDLEFQSVYNTLSALNCDSHFRRILGIVLVNSTNALGETIFEALPDNDGDRRVRHLQQNASAANASTTRAGLDVVYDVTGTCRGCQVTRAGSFGLYDNAFRRRRRILIGDTHHTIHIRTLSVTIHEEENRELQVDNSTDCQCAEGASPLAPRAPGVQECIEGMNFRFEDLRGQELGVFEDLEFSAEGDGLIQHDDLSELEEDVQEEQLEVVGLEQEPEGEDEEEESEEEDEEEEEGDKNKGWRRLR